MSQRPASLEGVSHSWPGSGQQVCRNVFLNLSPGAVHALVGENGAGKTTLGHILAGVQIPDAGVLKLENQVIDLASRRGGLLDAVGLIRQRSIWPPALSILECSFLGRKNAPRSRRKQLSLFMETADGWGLKDMNPARAAAGMDAFELQRAEMTAALMFQPEILVLDEPASAWEEGRGDEFFLLLERLKKTGLCVLLITHRLDDVFQGADTVTSMRHGEITGRWETGRVDYRELTLHMFGEEPDTRRISVSSPAVPAAEPVLEVRGVSLSLAGRRELNDLSFSVGPGEILGITGLKEEGLRVLEDVVSGNRRPDTGTLTMSSLPLKKGAAQLRKAGLRYVPSDKIRRGSSLTSTIAENLLLLDSRRLARRGWLNPGRVREWTAARSKAGGISGRPEQRLDELSGGNIQKVILQRELSRSGPLLVAADPTWGLDEKSRLQVQRQIRQIRDQGTAVLLLASDLDEALELTDRLAVLSGGRLSAFRPPGEWDRGEAARLIAGGGR